ncbi:MAG: hypothetical protein KJI71_01425 [Patescibacteria group bacterium]|nr:hypothetical protein [Patescibacteria group bacterium]
MAFEFDREDEDENKIYPIMQVYFRRLKEIVIDDLKEIPADQMTLTFFEDVKKVIDEVDFTAKTDEMIAATAMLVSDEKTVFHGIKNTVLFFQGERLLAKHKFIEDDDIYNYRGNHKKNLTTIGRDFENKFKETFNTKFHPAHPSHKINPYSCGVLAEFIVTVLYECILADIPVDQFLSIKGVKNI